MGGENKGTSKPQPVSSLCLVFYFVFLFCLTNCALASDSYFSPYINYLIDCGSTNKTKLQDGRIFKSDYDTTSLLSTTEEVHASVDSINLNPSSPVPPSSLPLYRTARIFPEKSTYTFHISKTGPLWLRLYFFPLPHASYDLTRAVFSVQTDRIVLLHDFSMRTNNTLLFKEYLINVFDSRFSLQFKPNKHSYAFINAIEVVSAPETLISDSATTVPTLAEFKGLSHHALQISYRVNVGGPQVTPNEDTLSRNWEPDSPYNIFPKGSRNVSVSAKSIKYPETGATPLIAPSSVYSTVAQMKDAQTNEADFNLSWRMNVEPDYSYLIRMHFCDIVSRSLNQLYFNVYINEMVGVSDLDLSSQTKALNTAFYKDFVLNASAITKGSITVQVGAATTQQGTRNAILNGVEVMKMSNVADSLDGLISVDGEYKGPSSGGKVLKIVAGIGLGLAATAMLFIAVICIRWKKRPQGWEKLNISSWLLPLSSSECKSKMRCSSNSKSSNSRRSSKFDSRKSKNGLSGYYSINGIGRFFPFSELQQATKNFDEKAVIGVGGFGKVYLGTLEDGTKVAIKRGNPSSEQGINEFRTELDMLSKLRHRHLVSLIGFCHEDPEMVLVYEYMANGPFRSHLYGSNLPSLSWKQRLEICIGSVRGLHYLHTGAAQSIIHRDVKTTNILLDENFVAKVSDFGLSKAVPNKAYVSTAVKGSFGYLDPEYYRSQQLTEKSDVYSFGVVLFEVLCGRPVICPKLPREEVNLADWAVQQHKRGMLHEIIDPRIVDTINSESLKKYVEAAMKCLQEHGTDRPHIGDVLWNLEYALQLQEAASQIQAPEEKSANCVVSLDQGDNRKEDDSIATTSDGALFSQITNFNGR